MWSGPADAAPIGHLTWELPYTMTVAKKRNKKGEREKTAGLNLPNFKIVYKTTATKGTVIV